MFPHVPGRAPEDGTITIEAPPAEPELKSPRAALDAMGLRVTGPFSGNNVYLLFGGAERVTCHAFKKRMVPLSLNGGDVEPVHERS